MVLRYALLGLLAYRPMSGYELTQLFQRTLAHAWPTDHSQIYPELNRLVADGLIVVSETGARRRKTYAITGDGLAAVRVWLTETTPARPARNEATLRTFLLWLLGRREALAFLDDERRAHEEALGDFEQILAEVDWEADDARFVSRLALEWGLRYERAYLEWVDWAQKAIVQREAMTGWGATLRRVQRALRRADRRAVRAVGTRAER